MLVQPARRQPPAAVVGTIFSKFYLVCAPNLNLSGAQSVTLFLRMFIGLLALYSTPTLHLIETLGRLLMTKWGPPPMPSFVGDMARSLARWRRRAALSPVFRASSGRVARQGGELTPSEAGERRRRA